MYQGLDELEHLLDRELALDDAFSLDEVAHLLHGPEDGPLLSHIKYVLMSFRKSTPPQNRQLDISTRGLRGFPPHEVAHLGHGPEDGPLSAVHLSRHKWQEI